MIFTEAIHERPQIWDSSYEGFRSNPTRQGAFNEVAELLSVGGPEVFTSENIFFNFEIFNENNTIIHIYL
jgi:hypothetical protein